MLTVGLDIGTTSVKAAMLDVGSRPRVVAQHGLPYPTARPHPGFAEQDPADWSRCVNEALSALPRRSEVEAVAISGQGSTICLCSREGIPIGPAIGWQDHRAVEDARELESKFRMLLDRAHGNQIGDASEPKLLWLARHEPERFAVAELALSAAGVVSAALGAEPSISIGDAASFLSLDHHTVAWDHEIADALQIRRLVPPVVACGEIIGRISRSAAAITGLPEGVPIVQTTTDLAAAAIASGAGSPGDVFYSKGTGGFVCTHVDRYMNPGLLVASPTGRRGVVQLNATIDSLGSAWDWCRALLGGIGNDEAESLATEAPAGSNGLVMIPWLSGAQHPVLEPDARGVALGLSLESNQGMFLRALLEGTAAMLGANLNTAEVISGVRAEQIVSSGGPTRNRLWNQLDAAAAGIPIIVASESNAAIGAALIAAEATGGCDDALIAGRALRRVCEEVEPDPDLAAAAASLLQVSRELGAASLPLFRRLGDERRSVAP